MCAQQDGSTLEPSHEPEPDGEPRSRKQLDTALRDLGLAAKSLQLYPPESPVVEDAVQQTHSSLRSLLDAGSLRFDINPKYIRSLEVEIGEGSPIIEELAHRLHAHGIARLHFEANLDIGSLQRFIQLIARERRDLDEQGGLENALRGTHLVGVHAELLELERLFAEGSNGGERSSDVWDTLLNDFSVEGSGVPGEPGEPVEWASVVGNVTQLNQFVGWFAKNLDAAAERAGGEDVEVCRHVLERLGTMAGTLGSEHVSFLALAVRQAADDLDPALLADLLAEPVEVEVASEPADDEEPPKINVAEFLSGADITSAAGGGMKKTLDVTRMVAHELTTDQAEALILHAIGATGQSSPRLYGLLNRVLEGRPDREGLAPHIRASLERTLVKGGDEEAFLAQWPKLSQVLDGEAPDRFVNSDYAATLRELMKTEGLEGAWSADLIRPRLAEMKPGFVIRKKAHVLARILDTEADDTSYVACAAELENLLNELVVLDDHKEAKRILDMLASHADDPDGSPSRTEAAAAVIERFYRPDTLRQLVRGSLGKGEEVMDLILGIIRRGGAEVVPVLLDALAAEDTRRVRERLLLILPVLGDAVLEQVVERLDDERWYYVRNLALILGELGDDSVLKVLGVVLDNADERVRRQAAESIVRIGTSAAEPHLLQAVEDEDQQVRGIAIHGLGFIAETAGIARLRELARLPDLRGQNTPTIQLAAIALGKLRDSDSRTILERLAKAPFLFRRRRRPAQIAAAWALDAIGDNRPGSPPEPRYLWAIRPPRPQDVDQTG